MCGNGNHQGRIADTSVTRRTMMLTMSAAAAAAGVAMPAFADDPGARAGDREGRLRADGGRKRGRCAVLCPQARANGRRC